MPHNLLAEFYFPVCLGSDTGRCFKVIERTPHDLVGSLTASYDHSYNSCKSEGMELATINSPFEQSQFEAYLATMNCDGKMVVNMKRESSGASFEYQTIDGDMRPLPLEESYLDWFPNELSKNGLVCAVLEWDAEKSGLKAYPCDSSFTGGGHCFACTSEANADFGFYFLTPNQPTSHPSAFPSKSASPSVYPSQEQPSASPSASSKPSLTTVPTDTPSKSIAPSFTPTYTRNVGTCIENTCLASVSKIFRWSFRTFYYFYLKMCLLKKIPGSQNIISKA